MGVGIPGGCEAAIHSARRFLQFLPPDHVMVKLDFSNAFNSLHRSYMLLSVFSQLPELYATTPSAILPILNLHLCFSVPTSSQSHHRNAHSRVIQ